jgi:hypothetical protein
MTDAPGNGTWLSYDGVAGDVRVRKRERDDGVRITRSTATASRLSRAEVVRSVRRPHTRDAATCLPDTQLYE